MTPVRLFAKGPMPALVLPESDIQELVDEGSRHASAALSSVFAFGLDVLGQIDLPPGSETQVDRAQMRALGALYLAADLEPAGIIASVETLASLAATGGIHLDLGPVAEQVHRFWRHRNDRPDPSERAAFYGRLFGTSYGLTPADGTVNRDFEPLMLELCEALFRLGEHLSPSPHGGMAGRTRVRSAARNLLSNLVQAGGGVTPFLASELMDALKQALAILKHPHLKGVFAARDIWDVIAVVQRYASESAADPRVFVQRGRAGMSIIVWLAEAAARLRQYGQPLVRTDDPIIVSAVAWLQSTLTISERQAGERAPRYSRNHDHSFLPRAGADRGSAWAELGA